MVFKAASSASNLDSSARSLWLPWQPAQLPGLKESSWKQTSQSSCSSSSCLLVALPVAFKSETRVENDMRRSGLIWTSLLEGGHSRGVPVLGLEVFLCCVGSRGVPVFGLEVFLCWV
ncbi:unnamed protein product [Arctogadus glacialis]